MKDEFNLTIFDLEEGKKYLHQQANTFTYRVFEKRLQYLSPDNNKWIDSIMIVNSGLFKEIAEKKPITFRKFYYKDKDNGSYHASFENSIRWEEYIERDKDRYELLEEVITKTIEV